MARLAGAYLPGRDLLESGRPFVEALAAELREAAKLAAVVDASADDVTDALEVLCGWSRRSGCGSAVAGRRSRCTLRRPARRSWRGGPPARSEALLGFGGALQRYGPRTITDPEVLRREIDRVRIRGVAHGRRARRASPARLHQVLGRDGALAGVIIVDRPEESSRIAQARVLPRIVDRLAETARRVEESSLAHSAEP